MIAKLMRKTARSLPREGRMCQAGGTSCDWGLGLEGAWKVRGTLKLSAWLECQVRGKKVLKLGVRLDREVGGTLRTLSRGAIRGVKRGDDMVMFMVYKDHSLWLPCEMGLEGADLTSRRPAGRVSPLPR